jgi:hypothetical protein
MGNRLAGGDARHATGLRRMTQWFLIKDHSHVSHILLLVHSVECYSRGGHEVITAPRHNSLS